jgi:hypothetical protein
VPFRAILWWRMISAPFAECLQIGATFAGQCVASQATRAR